MINHEHPIELAQIALATIGLVLSFYGVIDAWQNYLAITSVGDDDDRIQVISNLRRECVRCLVFLSLAGTGFIAVFSEQQVFSAHAPLPLSALAFRVSACFIALVKTVDSVLDRRERSVLIRRARSYSRRRSDPGHQRQGDPPALR